MPRFHRGDTVEVSSKQERFLGSYFEATIIKQTEKYEFCMHFWDIFLIIPKIRPIPPEIKASYFNIYDQVDVNNKDGWRVARIIDGDAIRNKRTGEDRSIYSVYSPSTGEEAAYRKWKLRAHKNG
ncbi:hypothetical protein MKX01_020713 [Papaver californicum]|nr:hypothetical protein MKX01_020713 [Papaver californicum]